MPHSGSRWDYSQRRLALRPERSAPSPNATNGATSATRRETGVTGFACGAGAVPLRRDPTGLVASSQFASTPGGSSPLPSRADPTEGPEGWTMATRRSQSTVDLARRRRGGLNRADGNRRVGRTIAARRQLAARHVSYSRVSVGRHDRAERRLGEAVAEQHRSSERYDAAVGKSAQLLAEVALHAADQEVGARDAWLRWVDDDRYRGLNAGPFELLAQGSGP